RAFGATRPAPVIQPAGPLPQAGGYAAGLAALRFDAAGRDAVNTWLNTWKNDKAAMTAFYKRMEKWDNHRNLRYLEPPKRTREHVADQRTAIVNDIYAQV